MCLLHIPADSDKIYVWNSNECENSWNNSQKAIQLEKWKWMTAERATNLFMIQWQEISIPTTMLFTRPTLYLVALFSPFQKFRFIHRENIYHPNRKWKMKYIFQLVRLERAAWDSLDVCRHSWANSSSSNSLVFLSSLCDNEYDWNFPS